MDDIYINDRLLKDDMVNAYNKSYRIKSGNNSEGSTPEFRVRIVLNSGLEISIKDVSDSKFIMNKNNSANIKSY